MFQKIKLWLASKKQREVELSPYNEQWPEQFQEEAKHIQAILGNKSESIHFIGSTAIPSMWAKPIIDILAVVRDLSDVDKFNAVFEKAGYHCMGEYGISGRRFYFKGTPKQHRVHIHLFALGHPDIERHLNFRDYLLQHPEVALGYANIKRALSKQFYRNVLRYVQAKDSFIRYIDYKTGHAKSDQLIAQDDIILEDYDPAWPKLAAAEIEAITHTTNLPYVRIEHCGSTAVKQLKAKPIIDIFIALESIETTGAWIKPLEALGYVYWEDNPDKLHHRFFKGMPPYGLQRTHHVHIMPRGQDFSDRVLFRDILRRDKKLREEYEQLKCTLQNQYSQDRERYTQAKAQFIRDCLDLNK